MPKAGNCPALHRLKVLEAENRDARARNGDYEPRIRAMRAERREVLDMVEAWGAELNGGDGDGERGGRGRGM